MNDPVDAIDALIARLLAHHQSAQPSATLASQLDPLANVTWPVWEYVVTQLQAASPPANLAFLVAANARWPLRSDIGFLLGNHLRVRGDRAGAERVLKQAVQNRPDDINAGLALTYLLREQGRLGEANRVLVDSWRQAPHSRSSDMATLQLLCENHGHELAATILPELLQRHPRDAALRALAGEIELLLGHFDAAAIQLRAAVSLDPTSAASWLRLAQTHRFASSEDADLQLLELARHEPSLPPPTRAAIGFAIGKVRADLGDIAGAVEVLRPANGAERERSHWNREAWAAFALAESQSPPLLDAGVQPPFTPVFIVGLPRSGTTLTAQLLSRRSDVRNRNELNWIAALAGTLGPAPDRTALRQAAQLIATHLRRDDAPAACYVDKNPLNFRHLRLIAALFPNARIIHCRRDIRDTALSIWSQHFAHADLAWAYDFADIAAFDSGYRQLMATAPRLNLPTFDLHYEQLVSETDATLERLHAFLGVPSTAPMAAVDDVAMATASVWQARQPVNRDSVQRWKAWAPHLPELTRAFPA